MSKKILNRIVEHEGLVHFWDGSDFIMHHKHTEYVLKKDNEWFPILTQKLIDQNNVTDISELIEIHKDQINQKNENTCNN